MIYYDCYRFLKEKNIIIDHNNNFLNFFQKKKG